MFQIIAIVLLTCLAIYTTGEVQREREIFDQEDQTKAVQLFVWLFPVPFALPLLNHLFWNLFFPVPIGAAAFFAPGMVVALANRKRFDRSPNPGVRPAAAAVDHVITFGAMGIMAAFVFTVILWVRH